MTLRTWDAFALRYATVERRRQENFIAVDPHDAATTMDYFVWFLRAGDETILVDTGFNADAARRRKRTFLRCPIASLAAFGVAPDSITDTLLTHGHYDHAGNLGLLPKTRFHLQEREMRSMTGRDMRHAFCRHAYAVDDVCELVRANFDQRLELHDGDYELRPGITVHFVGGHTRGLQIVRVHTRRGWIVLASDAAHYLENLQKRTPFPIVADTAQMLDGFERVEQLADSPAHIVPGHDPIVSRSYASVDGKGLEIFSLTAPLAN